MLDAALAYAQHNQPNALEELMAFLRIQSISTLPEHAADVRAAAEFLAAKLRQIGLECVRLIETDGHPLVYAEHLHAPGKPTLLLYGHYDVQPPDPVHEWISPPFEPEERNGNIYARGAVDDKGQLWMQVRALESLLASGVLPVNVRVLAEGEEEVGGEGIANYLAKHSADLACNAALVCDTELFAPNLPTLCVGLRGMIYTEIEVHGARTDLHSGMYGGVAPNPFIALAHIIAHLRDQDGTILIPGLLDGIKQPTKAELLAWQALPFDEEHYRETEVGSIKLIGEPGYSVLERTWARPTLDVHGMPGGFTGTGAKTVIPSHAVAKVSLRLVPGMNTKDTFTRLQQYVAQITPPGVTVDTRLIHSGEPVVVDTENSYVRAATIAMREVFGRDTVFVRGGGSIPVVGDFTRLLQIPTVLMGFGLPDDNLHAPNEKFCIANFYRGTDCLIHFLTLCGA